MNHRSLNVLNDISLIDIKETFVTSFQKLQIIEILFQLIIYLTKLYFFKLINSKV